MTFGRRDATIRREPTAARRGSGSCPAVRGPAPQPPRGAVSRSPRVPAAAAGFLQAPFLGTSRCNRRRAMPSPVSRAPRPKCLCTIRGMQSNGRAGRGRVGSRDPSRGGGCRARGGRPALSESPGPYDSCGSSRLGWSGGGGLGARQRGAWLREGIPALCETRNAGARNGHCAGPGRRPGARPWKWAVTANTDSGSRASHGCPPRRRRAARRRGPRGLG